MTMLESTPHDSQGKLIAWVTVKCIECATEIMKAMTAEVKTTPVVMCKDCYTQASNQIKGK